MYQGGTYMCYGHASSGRGLLGMLFLQTGAQLKEKGLFVSTGRPRDWMIQASSIHFDIHEARASGQVRLLWIPASFEGKQPGEKGGGHAIHALIKIIRKEKPDRLLINDFSPFLGFNSFELFQKSFALLMKQLDELPGTTVLLMMPAAVNKPSSQIIDFMRNHMTGSIHIMLEREESSENKRRVYLLPGIGHVNHEVFDHWKIPDLSPGKKTNRRKRATQRKTNQGETEPANRDREVSTEPSRSPAAQRTSSGSKTDRNDATPWMKAGSLAHIDEFTSGDEQLAVPAVGVELMQRVKKTHQRFIQELNAVFEQRDGSSGRPFLLVALRVESDQVELESGIVFEVVLSVLQSMIQDEGQLLVDEERERIISVLLDTQPGGVREWFELFQSNLKDRYPDQADLLPHAVSAVVVPDGQPFDSPEEFLAYALEGD